jgi:hypothetical protein
MFYMIILCIHDLRKNYSLKKKYCDSVDYIDEDKYKPIGDFLSDNDIIELTKDQEEREEIEEKNEDLIQFNIKVGSKIAFHSIEKIFLYLENNSKTDDIIQVYYSS